MNLKTLLKWLIPTSLLFFICIAALGLTGGVAWLTQRRAPPSTPAAPSSAHAERFSWSDLFKFNLDLAQSSETSETASNVPPAPAQVFIPVYTKPEVSDPTLAVLQPLHGLVQLQQADGSWQIVETLEITAGQTFRTWNYSSALLHFFDGSTVLLEANTRLTLEAVHTPTDGARTVTLFQPYGHTTHHVAQTANPIAYIVQTPSATGTATGTIFDVAVHEDKSSQFSVLEGGVTLQGAKNTVHLSTGMSSSVTQNGDPSAPVFWISGQGEVTQTGETWVIGGLEFHTHPGTLLIGNPQVGDLAAVRGRLLPDGTRLADRISLLAPSHLERFRLTGLVESMGATQWVISGQEMMVNETTQIDEGIETGSRVLVTGLIRSGGVLFATRITLLDETTGFEFTGLVEAIEGNLWTISGVAITVDARTVIAGDPVVGDLVHVEGRILPDGTWLAREITKVTAPDAFTFIGTVQSLDPWVVSGISFATNEHTLIEAGIVLGSTVRVTGLILPDGTWLATSIELLDDANTLVFIGIVHSTDPWIVNGLPLTVDENTIFVGEIGVDSLVRVTVLIQPDGTWLVMKMELIDVGPVIGCVEFVDGVVAMDRDTITLATGLVIPRAIAEIEGNVQVGSQVLVKLCFNPDHEMVYAWVLVLSDPPIRPTPTPAPTLPPPPNDEKVTLCHVPPGNPSKAHTITVGASAVQAHLAHGDYLGPCK